MNLNKFFYYVQLIFMLSLFWIAMFEQFSPLIVLSAPLISLSALWFSERFLMSETYYDLFPFHLHKLIWYGILLVFEIYKSGFSIVPSILSGNSSPRAIEIYTELDSNIEIALLANSITLTPGTITLDVIGHQLLVLWMNPTTTQPTMAGIIIKGALEKRLKGGL